MPIFQSTAELFSYLSKNIKDTLEDDVFEAVRDVEQKHIDSDVYDVYDPLYYERRDTAGGLIADQNIIKTMLNDSTLMVENTTRSDKGDFNLPQWIEEGLIKGFGSYAEPRPFTQNTAEDLQSNRQHVGAMKNGLNKRKISTKQTPY